MLASYCALPWIFQWSLSLRQPVLCYYIAGAYMGIVTLGIYLFGTGYLEESDRRRRGAK